MVSQVNKIRGIRILENLGIVDERGKSLKISNRRLIKLFDRNVGRDILLTTNYKAGTIRGLHVQSGIVGEAKYIQCIEGSIQEYFLDLRPKSKTFGSYMTALFSANEGTSVYIPPGIAHGYQTLVDGCTLLYVLSATYRRDKQIYIDFLDNDLAINFPLKPIRISEKDKNGTKLSKVIQFFKG